MLKVPWSNIVTSFPFIAIVLCNFTYEWGVYTFETLFPVFQKNILKLDIKLVRLSVSACVTVYVFIETSAARGTSHLHAGKIKYSDIYAVRQKKRTNLLLCAFFNT